MSEEKPGDLGVRELSRFFEVGRLNEPMSERPSRSEYEGEDVVKFWPIKENDVTINTDNLQFHVRTKGNLSESKIDYYLLGRMKPNPGPKTQKKRLWSVASTTGGKYVSVKGPTASSGTTPPPTPAVTATGESTSTTDIVDIEMVMVTPAPILYQLQFIIGTTPYIVVASPSTGAVATTSPTTIPGNFAFKITKLWAPNDFLCVLEAYDSLSGKSSGLYLSSNGAGVMKLKPWNSPIPGAPATTHEVDPALLFRQVGP